MTTYAILHNEGFGFGKANVLEHIVANSAIAARRVFFKKWAGHYATKNSKDIRATRTTDA